MNKIKIIKKIIVSIMMIVSLQTFGITYTVEKNVKLTQKDITTNNNEIQKSVDEIVKRGVKEITEILENEIDKIAVQQDSEYDFYNILGRMLSEVTKLYFENSKINVTKINYTSATKAIVEYEIKFPKIDTLDEEALDKKMEEKFFKKTGYKAEDIEKITDKTEMNKYLNVFFEAMNEVYKEEISKTNEYEVEKNEIDFEKVNGKWISKEFEEEIKNLKNKF